MMSMKLEKKTDMEATDTTVAVERNSTKREISLALKLLQQREVGGR